MRSTLENPGGNSDLLASVSALAVQIYTEHEAGQPYDALLRQLSKLIGKELSKFDVLSAFGTVSPESFARGLVLEREAVPSDLNHAELLELVDRLLNGRNSDVQASYWLRCLKENTGDPKISELIYWPGTYFGDGNNRREMQADEVLRIALSHGRRSSVT